MGAALSQPPAPVVRCGPGTLKIGRTCLIDPGEYVRISEVREIRCGHGTYLDGNQCRSSVQCGNNTGTDTTPDSTNTLTCGNGTYQNGSECVPVSSTGNASSTCPENVYRCDPLTTILDFDSNGGYCKVDTSKYFPIDQQISCYDSETKLTATSPNHCRVDLTKYQLRQQGAPTSNRGPTHQSTDDIFDDLNQQNQAPSGFINPFG